MVTDIWSNIDLADVLLKVVTPVATMILVWWKGGFKWLFSAIRRQLALRQYRSALRTDVSRVPIIGKKDGFDLARVYTPIEISQSDLMARASEQRYGPPNVFVLVGAPGGGKSTYVKNILLNSLRTKSHLMPLFFRLRDFDNKHSIEELIVRRIEAMGIKNAADLVRTELRRVGVLCVLDGLDEVRPNLVSDAHDAINSFYTTYFSGESGRRLIVTCRKEAYRGLPLAVPSIWEVLPLNDEKIKEFAKNWPLNYPHGRSAEDFWIDLSASEKILEVSRSPLLLVGGLLLYTESGLGIPGHRIKYLDRIKQTLIEDWAVAQGQPPDPLRDAYTPVLKAIALEMHIRAIPELRRDACLKIIGDFLPSVGQMPSTAPEFLDSIFRRTGILVQDTPGVVIFVQFTLQEYFASLAMTNKLDATEIAALEPKAWWREAILFVAAQVPDPSKLIEALFETSPMIGALAVAEAPTPSLRLQREAIDRAFQNLVAGDGASIPALVALLRRATRPLADDLARVLEEQVEQESALAANASMILASAGTDLATEALSRHPRSWQHCLKIPQLMSGKFEAKLAEWVKIPDHPNWTEAADLLVQLPTSRNLATFEKLLSGLPTNRANDLAIKALAEFRNQASRTDLGELELYGVICATLGYVDDVDQAKFAVAKVKLQSDQNPFQSNPGLILTCLELIRSKGWSGNAAKVKIDRVIYEAMMYRLVGRQYLVLSASSLLVFGLSGYFGLPGALSTIMLVAVTLVIAASLQLWPFPWSGRVYSVLSSVFEAWRILSFLLFGSIVTASLYTDIDRVTAIHLPSSPLTVFAALCVAICVPAFGADSWMSREVRDRLGFRWRNYELNLVMSTWIAILTTHFVFLLIFPDFFTASNMTFIFFLPLGVFIWSLFRITNMYRSSRALAVAANQLGALRLGTVEFV